jgi:hydroxymethylbilane synthase
LSLAQTQTVAIELKKLYPDLVINIKPIATKGDNLEARPLSLGLKGLFVKEIELALLTGQIDLAIHSAKDLPTKLTRGLTLGPTPVRGPATDALVTLTGADLTTLPLKAKVGTSSLRRRALLLADRPDLEVEPLRGNLDTRLSKLKKGSLAAVVLAKAGLERLRRSDYQSHELSPTSFTPAPGQGTLALEFREDDLALHKLLAPLNHPPSALALGLERGAALALNLGCSVPAGVYARPFSDGFFVTGVIASLDGQERVRKEAFIMVNDLVAAQAQGLSFGQYLLNAGGAAILARVAQTDLKDQEGFNATEGLNATASLKINEGPKD